MEQRGATRIILLWKQTKHKQTNKKTTEKGENVSWYTKSLVCVWIMWRASVSKLHVQMLEDFVHKIFPKMFYLILAAVNKLYSLASSFSQKHAPTSRLILLLWTQGFCWGGIASVSAATMGVCLVHQSHPAARRVALWLASDSCLTAPEISS